MKTTSPNGTFIDYTTGNLGVRVWSDRSRAIARDDESAGWIEQENVFTIPVPNRVLALQRSRSDAPVRAIAWNTALYENNEHDTELKKLLGGQISFDQVHPSDMSAFSLRPASVASLQEGFQEH